MSNKPAQAYVYLADNEGKIISERIQIPFIGAKLPAVFARTIDNITIEIKVRG